MFYQDFEDSLYTSITTLIPTLPAIFEHGNGPEEVTPYVTIQVVQLDQVGREQISTLANPDNVLVVKHYEGWVRFRFIGNQETQLSAGEFASDFNFFMDSPVYQETLLRNKLSLMRKTPLRRVPMLRDTDWYTGFQFDAYFAFAVEAEQIVDTIETVEYTATFNNPVPPNVVITQVISS